MAGSELNAFMAALAARLGGLKRGGELDTEGALTYLLRVFREGKLGPWTLDDLDGAEEAYIERFGEVRAPEANMRYSDLGAVGVRPTTAAVEPAPPINLGDGALGGAQGSGGADGAEEVKQVPLSLDQRVMLSVSRFMDRAAEQKADSDAGRNRSPTQMKKAARREKMAERMAKSEARAQKHRAAMAGRGR